MKKEAGTRWWLKMTNDEYNNPRGIRHWQFVIHYSRWQGFVFFLFHSRNED